MLILRIGGGALLLAAGLLQARERRRTDEAQIARLAGLLFLLRFTRREIADFRTPLREIYARFEDTALAACGFLCALRADGLASALKKAEPDLALRGEAARTLTELGSHLGRGRAEEELALLDRGISQLDAALAVLRTEAPRTARVRSGLFTVAALMLTVLLL